MSVPIRAKRTFFIYLLASACEIQVAMAQTSNGFDLTGALVPVAEILAGGPPRDGIPALTDPAFVPAAQAGFLEPRSRVLGIYINRDARAYPIAILNWHELVNDQVGGQDVLISYCPLCGSGVAHETWVDGKRLEFGVSGLLYNSDVLFYDRATESLWSQLQHRAISGSLRGCTLQMLPLIHTTWADWQARHPDTQVLSMQTGHARDYRRNPYEGYEQDEKVMFPVAFRASGYHPKEQVLGLQGERTAKAYPFAELARAGDELRDELDGKQIIVRFNAEHRLAEAFDTQGRPVPGVVAFWFAWYAFHPDTAVFRVVEAKP